MTADENLKRMRVFTEELSKDPEKARAFIRKVMGPPRRALTGEEYDKIWTMLQLVEPYHQSNNQRTWTDRYRVGKIRYDVTYGLGDEPEIEEVDDSENS